MPVSKESAKQAKKTEKMNQKIAEKQRAAEADSHGVQLTEKQKQHDVTRKLMKVTFMNNLFTNPAV